MGYGAGCRASMVGGPTCVPSYVLVRPFTGPVQPGQPIWPRLEVEAGRYRFRTLIAHREATTTRLPRTIRLDENALLAHN
ncbi:MULTISPECIES: hypothetical protein [Streptomyces]|uniref:hypothetical protein n=1 Tax=Streptomyces TaxID=1883 RepID=UPI000BFD521B|nr:MULTISPECIES: hypothetical protein [unclassified Streptomyces]